MSERSSQGDGQIARSAAIFGKCTEAQKQIIRTILKVEREVMLMDRRSDIHQTLVKLIKEAVK